MERELRTALPAATDPLAALSTFTSTLSCDGQPRAQGVGANVLDGLTPVGTAELETFDGLVATLSTYEVNGKPLVSVRFEYKQALAEAPARRGRPARGPRS